MCRMKGWCTIQAYRRITHLIFLSVIQLQSIHFSQDNAVYSAGTLDLGFSSSLWHCCACPEAVTITGQ